MARNACCEGGLTAQQSPLFAAALSSSPKEKVTELELRAEGCPEGHLVRTCNSLPIRKLVSVIQVDPTNNGRQQGL
jgi:hypothetical protein